MNRTFIAAVLLLTVSLGLLFTAAVLAVTPVVWTQTSEADFSQGQFSSTVLSSRGEVMLSRDIQVLMKTEQATPLMSAVALAGKTLYAASGNKNIIYKIDGQKVTTFSQPPGTMVTSLLHTGKELLAGTGGDKAGIYRIDGQGKAAPLWVEPKVKYVWAMVQGPKDTLFAATGPEATVYAIDAAGKGTVIYQAPAKLAKNILCLALSPQGKLYAGTDTSGLLIEIDPTAKTGRVVLDSQEKEISGVLIGENGDIFASTSDPRAAIGTAGFSNEKSGQADTLPATSKASSMPSSAPVGPTGQTTSFSASKDLPEESDSSDDEEEPQPETPPAAARPGPVPSMPMPSMPPSMGGAPGGGNAVYRIHSDGLVTTFLRRPITILAMAMNESKLILATGNNGTIYSVSLDGDEIIQLAKTEAKQITALAIGDGRIYFTTSNKGSVASIGKQYAAKGTYTSKAQDAKQIAQWGTVQIAAAAPKDAKVTVATRSGNVAEPDDKTWSAWSAEQPVVAGFLTIESPAARFLQYRLNFQSDGKATAVVTRVSSIYQVSNMAPVISAVSVQVAPKAGGPAGPRMPMPRGDGEEKAPKFMRFVTIQAADPNNDHLIYAIYFREAGASNWIKIADKLAEPQYPWDTHTVGDGTYELRVTASDSPSNPPSVALEAARISTSFVVDNTPPTFKEVTAKADGLAISAGGIATDNSRLAGLYYAVDSQEEWVSVLPKDGICDSNTEAFAFKTKELTAGSHRIAFKAEDIYGNAGYAAVTVTVAK